MQMVLFIGKLAEKVPGTLGYGEKGMPDSGRRTILIIDDNVTNLKTAMAHLEAYSFEIIIARSGVSGLERAELAGPDLILLDIQMPGLGGFETCRRLKANPATARIPVIFMTVASDTASKVEGLEAGAVDYITKPFEAAELLARVNTHIALYTLQERLEALVQERTAQLETEMARRQRQQSEKEQLWETVGRQNEQLHSLTRYFLEAQRQQQQGTARTLDEQVSQNLGQLAEHLQTIQAALSTDEQGQDAGRLVNSRLAQAQTIVAHLQQQARQVTAALNQASGESDALLHNPLLQLSNREREVLQLLVSGKSTGEIAQLLTLAPGTVSTYRRRIMEKLDVSDLAGLIRFADQQQLLPPNI